MVGIKRDLDLISGSAGSPGINAGDDVSILTGRAQIQISFRTHQFGHFHVHINGGTALFGIPCFLA